MRHFKETRRRVCCLVKYHLKFRVELCVCVYIYMCIMRVKITLCRCQHFLVCNTLAIAQERRNAFSSPLLHKFLHLDLSWRLIYGSFSNDEVHPRNSRVQNYTIIMRWLKKIRVVKAFSTNRNCTTTWILTKNVTRK